ncbi:universal stress protein [Pseudonocardia petroleophila]|uniref:Universal stress protein n=1 Tax=Pseudonocardia petroleophila TaxID=37331 RepID=A0A7G7MCU2_9PSEU|nr:universal stress protein [Pseudonocardia petroleophila]QNG50603.1 universal stress protein [Pseudonocardia petroleophila]
MSEHDIRRTVVVGVDGSDSATDAVRWGAAEAARRRVPLRLVIGFGWPAEEHLPHGTAYREQLLGRARGHLAAAAGVAAAQQPGLDVEQQLIVGSPIAVLGAEAERAQLVVVGDRGASRLEGLLLGSVAVALAAHAACPVAVVRWAERESAENGSLPVVLGVDGSATSQAAIAFAFEAASARKVPVVAVHTWSGMVFDPGVASMGIDWAAIEDAERELLADQLAGWAEKFPDTFVEQVVTRDRPAHALLEQAARAQLVVVGSRGRGEVAGLVLGSVGNALVHRSPCPVVVVRPDAAAPVQPGGRERRG